MANVVETVDNTVFDDEADANSVFMAIKQKAAKYNHIGRDFGLAPSTIDSIKKNHPGDNAGALQDVINEWVRQNYNTERFGFPSWRKVVEVISNQGDNLLAKRIAKDHPIKPTDVTRAQEEYMPDSAIQHPNELEHSAFTPEDTYLEASNVDVDGGGLLSRLANRKRVHLEPSEEFEPLDRGTCQTETLEFKFGKVQPQLDRVKGIPLNGAYEMKSVCHGLAVIINNEKFETLGERKGTNIDEENLTILFRFLGYKVLIYRDINSNGMYSIFKEVQQVDHSKYDSFVCCILSHGDEKGVLYGTDDEIKVNIIDLTEKLNGDKCKKLKGKPKLFFIQACRGENKQKRVATDGEHLPNTSDFFFSFAVPHGYKAYRHETKGSDYVNELCRALSEHATHASLIEIMQLVHQRVAETSTRKSKTPAQAPELVCRLQKHVFFF